MFVKRTRTIVTLEDIAVPFADALERHTGAPAEVIDVATFYGKVANECGHPGPDQCCWCLNVGNIRGRSKRGRFTLLAGAHEYAPIGRIPKGWHEIPNPAGHVIPPGMAACLPDDSSKQEFRAYESIAEAIEEAVEVLGRSFPKTLREFASMQTEPARVVRAMKADGYFTGDEGRYVFNVGSVARGAIPRVEKLLKKRAEPITFEILAHFDGAATFIRAGEGEHTPRLRDDEPIDFDSPSFLDRVRGFFRRR